MRSLRLGATTAAFLLLAACAAPPGQQQEQSGVLIGAVVGGLLGSQIGHGGGRAAATVVGAVAGAVVGGNIGRAMDESDRLKTALALENVRTGVPSQWRNPDSGHSYVVVPQRTFETAQGPCREYTVDAVIGGRSERVYGTACRQPDGSWRAAG